MKANLKIISLFALACPLLTLTCSSAELSLKSTNDYLLTSGLVTNGICGSGIGAGGKNTMMRYEDMVFLEEAIRERTIFDATGRYTNRVDSAYRPWLFRGPNYKLIGAMGGLIAEGRVYNQEQVDVCNTGIVDVTSNVYHQGCIANGLFPTNTSAWLGYERFWHNDSSEDPFYFTNKVMQTTIQLPLMTNMANSLYGNLTKMKYALMSEREPELASPPVVQSTVAIQRGFNYYPMSDGWRKTSLDRDTPYSYTYQSYGPSFEDRYSFRKRTQHDETYGLDDVQSYTEYYYTLGGQFSVQVNLNLLGNQILKRVVSLFVKAKVELTRTVQEFDEPSEFYYIINGTYLIPIGVMSAREQGTITANIDLDSICGQFMTKFHRVKPSSNGPEIADLIDYPEWREYAAIVESYAQEVMTINPKELVGIVEIQWNARELDE